MTRDVLFCNISQMILKKLNLFKNFLKTCQRVDFSFEFSIFSFQFPEQTFEKRKFCIEPSCNQISQRFKLFRAWCVKSTLLSGFFCHVNSKMFSVPAARIEMQTLPVRTSSCKSSIPSKALAAITFIWLFCKSMYFSFGLNWNKFGSNWVRLPLSK